MSKMVTWALALISLIGAAFAVNDRFESRAHADSIHEQMANDRENDELRTRLQIIEIQLQKFTELAAVRPLTQSEEIQLRAIEAERQVILARLAAKS